MKNMSDEELINQAAGFSCGCDKCLARVEPPRMELLSRLERGRKAIDAMGKAINCRETFLKSEMSVLGDLDMAADNFASSIHKIIEGYQQSCKEAADEN
jgi:hypothetical protein